MPGLPVPPRPTTSWMRYRNGHQDIPSPPTIRSRPDDRPAMAGCEPIAGAVSLLQTLRTAAAGRRRTRDGVVLPVPGDVRGLPAGTQFQRDAVAAGEASSSRVIRRTGHRPGPRLRISTTPTDSDESERSRRAALRWTVYSLPEAPLAERLDLGEAEYAMRSAVRSAADALGALAPKRRPGHRGSRAGWSNRCWNPSGAPRSRPRPVAGTAGARERRPHRRDHHGQLGTDPDRAEELVGGADRQRSAAAADRGRALGPTGGRQRDPAVGLALRRPAVRGARRPVDRKSIQRRGYPRPEAVGPGRLTAVA